MNTQVISSLMAHGAIEPHHVDKIFASPNKEKIVSDMIRAADYRTGLPENLAMKIVNDRSLIKHHRSAIDYGLSGGGAEKYFKANAARPLSDNHEETRHHVNSLLSAGNAISTLASEIAPSYDKLPDRIKAHVVSGIKHSTSEHLNAIDPGSNEVASNLGNHNNANDRTMFNVKDSSLSPAVKNASLMKMIENRHNKLSGYAIHHAMNHLTRDSNENDWSIHRAVAQHPATMEGTLNEIANKDTDIGYGTEAAIYRHPNATEETRKILYDKHGYTE